jgi:hypothetical protein
MATGEEIAIEFYQPGNAEDLASCLIRFLSDPEKQKAMAVQNFSTALRMTMPTIIQKYLRHFELEQRTEALRRVTRFRRMPGWLPSRALMLRLMTRNSPGWVHRSAIHRLPWTLPGRKPLLDNHSNGGGKLSGTGVPNNGDGVTAGSRYADSILDRSFTPSAAGDGNGSHDYQSEQRESLNTPLANKGEAHHSEGQQPGGEDWIKVPPLGQIHPSDGSSGNGKGGSSGSGAGSEAGGSEGATQIARKPATGE